MHLIMELFVIQEILNIFELFEIGTYIFGFAYEFFILSALHIVNCGLGA